MEVSDARRRLRATIEEARRRAADRRRRVDEANSAYERLLAGIAVPAFHTMASALVGEGHRFKVSTPGQTVRLASEFSADDYVELTLDTDRDAPAVVLRSSRGRGRRTIRNERVVAESTPIAELTEDDVVHAVLEELLPFLER